jgi:Xaa-Pro aminopeptidase
MSAGLISMILELERVVDSLKKRFAHELETHNLDALVLASPENVFHVSGIPVRHMEFNPVLFVVSNQYPSWVVIDLNGDSTLVTWDLALSELEPSVSEVKGIRSREEALESIKEAISEKGLSKSRVGLEARCPLYLYEALVSSYPQASFEMADQIPAKVRMLKTNDELMRMANASKITSEVITSLFEGLQAGLTDRDLIIAAKKSMLEKGAAGWDHLSLSAGVGSGLFPFKGYRLRQGDLVGTDFGAIFNGYTADMNRLCILGRASESQVKFYQDLIGIEDQCIKEIKPGKNISDVYNSAIEGFKEAKMEPATKLFGHSIGIQVEENPLIKEGIQHNLEANMVINFEIYCKTQKGQFVGIEDTFLLTESGNRQLTTADRRLFEA